MAEVTEGKYAGEFIASEANGSRSRKTLTIKALVVLIAAQVIALLFRGAASAAAVAGNTGDGTVGDITVGIGGKLGAYVLTIVEPGTNVGDFIVEDPDGINVGAGAVASAFSGGGLGFTLADGDADFIAGDQIVITVAAGTGEVVAFDQDGTDGSEVAAGISYDNYDATDGAIPGVIIVRDAEVNGNDLAWPADIEAAEQTAAEAQLEALGIIVRT